MEGKWNQKVLHVDDLLGKQNTAAVEVMAETSVSGEAQEIETLTRAEVVI